MKKYFSVAILLIGFYLNGLAQKTGVNTKHPQGVLHVDAKKNNATTGAPTGTQPDDDFIVDANGNVGIGILAPSTRLHLRSTGTPAAPIPAIRIEDGTQGANYVLTSDINGSAKWVHHPVMAANVVGVASNPATVVVSNYGGTGTGSGSLYRSTGFTITLTEGDWIVSAGLTFVEMTAGPNNAAFWQRAYLSSSATQLQQNGFSHLGVGGINTCYGGPMVFNPKIGFVTGSSVINVPSGTTTTIYLLIENKLPSYYTYQSDFYENYFYATPIVR